MFKNIPVKLNSLLLFWGNLKNIYKKYIYYPLMILCEMNNLRFSILPNNAFSLFTDNI